ncbi:MAG TPA: hypothetical protein VMM76_27020, partial [Pirellulaceae bacterium]|nr:hypothetical protein [Pirellulaceae bacterium]
RESLFVDAVARGGIFGMQVSPSLSRLSEFAIWDLIVRRTTACVQQEPVAVVVQLGEFDFRSLRETIPLPVSP